MKSLGSNNLAKNLSSWLITGGVLLVLYSGWRLRRFDLLTAESGLGYVLGIAGASFILLLLIYPLRKRYRILQRLGCIRSWFRLHMIMGVLGPVFIIFHANFQTGSLNSTVALYAMLLVAASGLVGRYIYTRIHQGLYGKRAQMEDLQSELSEERHALQFAFSAVPKTREALLSYAARSRTSGRKSLAGSLRSYCSGMLWRRHWYHIKAELHHQFKSGDLGLLLSTQDKQKLERKLRKQSKTFLRHTVKVTRFSFWERLFSLWHVLHIPLVFVLLFTIVMHVYAVHRF